MRIVGFIAVKDDVEVIGPCVENLVRLGFDDVGVVAISPSAEMRDAFEAAVSPYPNAHAMVFDELDPQGDFLSLSSKTAVEILTRFRPDWVFACDADEFLVISRDDIHDVADFAAGHSISVDRYNYARRRGENVTTAIVQSETIADAPLVYEREYLERGGELMEGRRWSQHKIWPKLFIRPHEVARAGPGTHTAIGHDGQTLELETAREMVIVHLPFTTYQRFEAKVTNARNHLNSLSELHRGRALSWHWKGWVRALEEDALRETYIREAFAQDEFAALRESGAIRTARELLAQAGPTGG